ncbi:MAG: tetratricopeptide repeat protein [Candidatus Omnitrophica bacterium]|nr:tetratricopeptide repeat protein [Candidatus Omnitrophota bacterium]
MYKKITLILFGLFLTIIILEIGLRIAGFTILSIQEYRNQQSIRQKGAYCIMCLGESTTQDQYSPYLEEILNQHNIGIKFSVIDKGLGGTRTVAILSQLEPNLDKYQPDTVITMMGINDAGRHLSYETNHASKIVFILKYLKVYKLTRLLWLHIVTKSEEIKSFIQIGDNKTPKSKRFGQDISKNKFKRGDKKQDSFIRKQAFKKAIEINYRDSGAYAKLGLLYRDLGRFAESEQAYKKAIEIYPKDSEAYLGLGQLCRDLGRFAESEQAFKKAIEINYRDSGAYTELGLLYRDLGRFAESEQAYKKAIEIYPNDSNKYVGLGYLYRELGRFAESEQAYKKAIEINPDDDRLVNDSAYEGLATLYSEIGNNELSEICAKKANNIRSKNQNPATVNNYRAIKKILDKRKIKLICVQYPMRNIEPLKKIFKEEAEGSIVFVDNEKIFKDAVRKEGYKEYFKDMFAGDFGHCTAKGNMLLAENIANAILKEIFGK